VEIKAIAREPGSRSKVAVAARQEGVDPVGCCVGLRGFRIQTIVNELQGEKIDVVQWHKDTAGFIANTLSPAQVLRVDLNADDKVATAIVPDKVLSLAIGKEGQNARLTAKLTGWKIEVRSLSDDEAARAGREMLVASELAAVAATDGAGAVPTVEKAEAVAPAAEAPAALTPPEPASLQPVAAAPSAPPAAPEEAPQVEAPVAPAPEAPKEEAAPAIEALPEAVWSLPAAVKEPQVLRFAEEILPGRGQGAKDRKARRGREDERGKGKKGTKRFEGETGRDETQEESGSS
jgi:N utilization substance protein A